MIFNSKRRLLHHNSTITVGTTSSHQVAQSGLRLFGAFFEFPWLYVRGIGLKQWSLGCLMKFHVHRHTLLYYDRYFRSNSGRSALLADTTLIFSLCCARSNLGLYLTSVLLFFLPKCHVLFFLPGTRYAFVCFFLVFAQLCSWTKSNYFVLHTYFDAKENQLCFFVLFGKKPNAMPAWWT